MTTGDQKTIIPKNSREREVWGAAKKNQIGLLLVAVAFVLVARFVFG